MENTNSKEKPLSNVKIPLAPLRAAIIEKMKESEDIDLLSLLELVHRVYLENRD